MRIALAGFVPDAAPQADSAQHVEALTRCSCGRLLHRRLEAVREIENDVRLLHLGNLARRQLDVVRLGARRRQVLHVGRRPAGALGCKRKRVEGCDDRLAAPCSGRSAATGRRDEQGDAREKCGNGSHLA